MVLSTNRFFARPVVLLSTALLLSIFTSSIAAQVASEPPAQEAATYEEGESWVTDYLRSGGSLGDITGVVIPSDTDRIFEDAANSIRVQERSDLPAAFDWREKVSGGLQQARYQGGCGSCWAFSVTAVVEALQIIKHPAKKFDLSEQSVVSCSGAGSCGGGYFNAFDYAVNTGLADEVQFPYTASQVGCKSGLNPKVKISKWAYITNEGKQLTTAQIKSAIMTYGPVATVVNASFTSYQSGVFNNCNTASFNHMVTLEGWSDEDGGYWIMRNSWGTQWGENGYMRIRYTDAYGNKCNRIGETAAFAVLAQGSR